MASNHLSRKAKFLAADETRFRSATESFLGSDLFLLLLGCLVFLWWNKHSRGLHMDALIYTTVAKNLAASGRLWELSFTAWSMERFFGHTPLLLWLQGLVFRVFSFTPFTAHLVPLAASTLTVWGVFRLGTILRNRWTGLVAGFLLLLSPQFLKYGTMPFTESLLTMSAVLTVLFYVLACEKGPRWLLLAGFCAGLGFLAKGPLILGVGGALLADILVRRRFRFFTTGYLYGAVALFLLVCGVWIVPDFLFHEGVWVRHYFGTQLTGSLQGRGLTRPDLLNYTKLLFLYQPHIMIPFCAALVLLFRKLFKDRYDALLLVWFLTYFVGLSVMKWQLAHYIHPVYPVIALITATLFAGAKESIRNGARLTCRLILFLAAAILLVATSGPQEVRYRSILPVIDHMKGYQDADYEVMMVRPGHFPWAEAGLFKIHCSTDLAHYSSLDALWEARKGTDKPVFVIIPDEAFLTAVSGKNSGPS